MRDEIQAYLLEITLQRSTIWVEEVSGALEGKSGEGEADVPPNSNPPALIRSKIPVYRNVTAHGKDLPSTLLHPEKCR